MRVVAISRLVPGRGCLTPGSVSEPSASAVSWTHDAGRLGPDKHGSKLRDLRSGRAGRATRSRSRGTRSWWPGSSASRICSRTARRHRAGRGAGARGSRSEAPRAALRCRRQATESAEDAEGSELGRRRAQPKRSVRDQARRRRTGWDALRLRRSRNRASLHGDSWTGVAARPRVCERGRAQPRQCRIPLPATQRRGGASRLWSCPHRRGDRRQSGSPGAALALRGEWVEATHELAGPTRSPQPATGDEWAGEHSARRRSRRGSEASPPCQPLSRSEAGVKCRFAPRGMSTRRALASRVGRGNRYSRPAGAEATQRQAASRQPTDPWCGPSLSEPTSGELGDATELAPGRARRPGVFGPLQAPHQRGHGRARPRTGCAGHPGECQGVRRRAASPRRGRSDGIRRDGTTE